MKPAATCFIIGSYLPWRNQACVGEDYPYDGRWARPTPSSVGMRLTLGGCAGLTLGCVEGMEINILGAVAGLDIRHPAIKFPGTGRIGLSAARHAPGFGSAEADTSRAVHLTAHKRANNVYPHSVANEPESTSWPGRPRRSSKSYWVLKSIPTPAPT